MKTPRDFLLGRHQSVASKLDAIRRQIVAEEASSEGFLQQIWMELFWSCRRMWTGLAVIWVLLLIMNVSQRDGAQTAMAKSQPTAAMIMALRHQEKMLNEN